MNRIHNNKLNNIVECNLLHDIINLSKRAENINSHYYPILHGCMNTRKCIEIFKNIRILLDIVFSSMVFMRRLINKLNPTK